MHRTSNTFSVLQAIAVTASLAILLWSIGMPSLRFAEAADITSFSDTLSTSEPSVAANHTISFVATNGVAAGETITITIPDTGFTGIGSIAFGDVDLFATSERSLAAAASGADWGVSAAGQTITITSGTDTITAGDTVTIEIGTNATAGTTGVNQITNSATPGSYEVQATSGSQDSGETRVAIVQTVTVSASVDTLLTFDVAGVAGGTTVNTADTTGASTTATEIQFGELDAGTASTAAQQLSVTTNAINGFTVTVQTDQQLLSTNGADIDGFVDGAFTTSPTAWAAPTATPGSENEYGHWGLTTDDASLSGGNTFNVGTGGNRFVSASTTPVEVFYHNGPADGSTQNEGTALVGYKVEVSSLQEAATDYTAALTYVATPVF